MDCRAATAARVAGIAPFHLMEVQTAARALEAAGHAVVHMEIGEPDIPTPAPVAAAAQPAIAGGGIYYTSALGSPDLRQAISRPMTAPWRVASRIVVVAATGALAGCSAIEFYWQGIAGQAEILALAKPISDVIETTPDPALKARLARAQAIREFASRALALPDNRSYTNYADLGRPFVVWNVFAAPELSLSPRQWCFPVAGCVSYRGYFAESDARAEAARLAAEGDDVHVGGVPAYSTLGYFDDPVLSTFVRYGEFEFARLIFHELAHQVVYVKDDSSFNESFATSVEEEGIARWLVAESSKRDSAGAAALASDAARGQRVRADFRAMIASARARLAALYAGSASDEEKRAAKAAVFAEVRAGNERQKAASDGAATFDRWFAAGANNAGVVAAGLYADRVPQFKALLEAENGDLVRFYGRVKALAALPKAEREPALVEAARR